VEGSYRFVVTALFRGVYGLTLKCCSTFERNEEFPTGAPPEVPPEAKKERKKKTTSITSIGGRLTLTGCRTPQVGRQSNAILTVGQ
jgi:hypothetical protein